MSWSASYYVCGFNINKQITPLIEGNLPYICCPVEFSAAKRVLVSKNPVQISLSHIFWKNGNEWNLSGYKARHLENIFDAVRSSPLVRSSERRVTFLTENNDVVICTPISTKKLHLQGVNVKKESLEDTEIEDIAVEDNHLLCLSNGGKLFSCGVEVPLPGIKIGQISVGKEHCLALTTDGKVLSWGNGMRGQLGNGEIMCVDEPELVSSLEGIKIVSVCCGGWHSTALSASGDVYLWGWNDVGQLGFRSRALLSDGVKWDGITHSHKCLCQLSNTSRINNGTSQVYSPNDNRLSERGATSNNDRKKTGLKFLNMINHSRCMEPINVQASPKLLDFWAVDSSVKKVACGDRHTVFLMENGTAWTTGWNMYGQLGIGSTTSKDDPQVVSLNAVNDVFAGGWNSVFIAASHHSHLKDERKMD